MDRLEYSVGRFKLRPHRQLLDDGVPVSIGRKALGLLTVLAEADGALVTKDELMAAVWPNAIVEDNAVQVHIAALRKALGPDAALLGTVHGLGYRLAAPPSAPFIAGPVEPLLAVLAFDNLCEAADMVWFTDGVSEEIQQTVARTTKMQVIGRGSSFQFRGADKAASHVAASLGATHVLDGSVRRGGAMVRISAQLVECARGVTLWSDRFDRDLSDIFGLQDEIAAAVAAALRVAFAPSGRPTHTNPAAYDLYLRAMAETGNLHQPATHGVIIDLLEQATDLAPEFARAWASLATMRARRMRMPELGRPATATLASAVEAAQTALQLDPGSGEAYQALGQLEPWAHYERREALQQKALSVAPNDPTVAYWASAFVAEVGRIDEAIGHVKRQLELDPAVPSVFYPFLLGVAGRSSESREAWRASLTRWPESGDIVWNAIGSAAANADWGWFDQLIAGARAQGFYTDHMRDVVWLGRNLRNPNPESLHRALDNVRAEIANTGSVALTSLTSLHALGLTEEVFELIDQASFSYLFDTDQSPAPPGPGHSSVIFSLTQNRQMVLDPRFVRLCAKLGLCDYWVQTERWPDCVQLVAYDFKAECKRLVAP